MIYIDTYLLLPLRCDMTHLFRAAVESLDFYVELGIVLLVNQ